MNILVLGGTQFVGRHIVKAFLDAGHSVSIFSRGKTNPDLFPQATKLIGDRDSDLSAIEDAVSGHRSSSPNSARRSNGSVGFDACVDVSGYETAQVERSLEAAGDYVGRYLYISTVSTYKVPVEPYFTEDSPVEETDEPYAKLSPETYGRLKAECERTVRRGMGDEKTTVFRLGLVNGPWDHTDRATYWSLRAEAGGEIFVPATPDTPFQVIDARDIGLAAVHVVEKGISGTYNMVNQPTTWKEWLDMSARSAPSYVFVDDQEWIEQKLGELEDTRPNGPLPMYLPEAYGWEFWQASNQRARDAGMVFRPYGETIADTVAWRKKQDYELRAGLTPDQEAYLIERWRD